MSNTQLSPMDIAPLSAPLTRPLNTTFTRQMNAARSLYGPQLVWLLVLLCFFSSMAATNDVALITFVPFTFTVLDLIGPEAPKRLTIPIVVPQTVAGLRFWTVRFSPGWTTAFC